MTLISTTITAIILVPLITNITITIRVIIVIIDHPGHDHPLTTPIPETGQKANLCWHTNHIITRLTPVTKRIRMIWQPEKQSNNPSPRPSLYAS